MHRYFPQRSDKVRATHNVQQDMTIEDIVRNVPRIYITLDNKHADFQSHMIKVECKINDQPISILIDSRAIHSYLDPKLVEIFHLSRRNLGKPWFVQLDTGEKRKTNDMVKACPLEMNGLCTKVDLNIIALGLYDCLIGMDWLDENHVVLDCYNKEFTFLDEQGNLRSVQGILRDVTIKEISTLQLKKSYRNGFQVFIAVMSPL
jgi:hypothetical protein